MDDRKRQLVALIIKDETERHKRNTDVQFRDYNLELNRRHQENRKSRARMNAVQTEYENYNSGRWVHEASILETHAERFISEAGEKIRAETLDPAAGEALAVGARKFLDLLTEKYEHRFKMAKSFYAGGRNIGLPIYWSNLSEGLQRKIEIERLKFAAEPVDRSSRPVDIPNNGANRTTEAATGQGVRVKQERVEKWFREVRCPAFDGQEPPNWGECWDAAKAYFAPGNVVREVLFAARRAAAPPHWQTTGKNRTP